MVEKINSFSHIGSLIFMISTNINKNIICWTKNFVNYFVPNIISHKYDNQYKIKIQEK